MTSRPAPAAPSAPAPSPAPAGTRERLIAAMLDALQRRGLHGMGLNELLASAGAPKGVLYHHFPGGKTELAVAAVDAAVAQMLDRMQGSGLPPDAALAAWMDSAHKLLAGSGYERGCPLATIALESTPEDEPIRQALARGFDALRTRLADWLAAHGVAPDAARRFAALFVSAYEGALLQSRVAQRADALRDTCDALIELIRPQLAPRG